MKNFIHRLEYIPVRILEIFIRILPIPVLAKFCKALGLLAFWILSKRRELAISNIDRVYGNRLSTDQKRNLALKSFQHVALSIGELFWMKKRRHKAAEFFEFFGTENAEKAFRDKRGIIFVVSHLGSWEYLGFLPFLKGFPCSTIVKSIRNPYIDRDIQKLRESTGLEPINKKNASKLILKHLRRNHLVAILIDQWAGPEGIWVDFFGTPASTTSIPVRLAMQTGSSLVPAYCIRRRPGHYEIHIEPEIPVHGTGPAGEIETTLILNKNLEKLILQYPDQWLWGHRRWKPKPSQIRDPFSQQRA